MKDTLWDATVSRVSLKKNPALRACLCVSPFRQAAVKVTRLAVVSVVAYVLAKKKAGREIGLKSQRWPGKRESRRGDDDGFAAKNTLGGAKVCFSLSQRVRVCLLCVGALGSGLGDVSGKERSGRTREWKEELGSKFPFIWAKLANNKLSEPVARGAHEVRVAVRFAGSPRTAGGEGEQTERATKRCVHYAKGRTTTTTTTTTTRGKLTKGEGRTEKERERERERERLGRGRRRA